MKITNRQLWTAGLLYGDPVKLGAHDPGPKRKYTPRERVTVQTPVLHMLRLHPRVAWVRRMNSGAYKTKDGRFIRYGFPGCADIIGQMKKTGAFLALECKFEDEEPTEEQQAFIDMVRENGGVAGVVRSINDALEIVEG